MRPSKADRPHKLIAAGEGQAIRGTVNVAISPIADLAVVVAIVHEGYLDIEFDPSRERYAMLRNIDGLFGRSKSDIIVYTICV
jgi:hypothetical protein